MNAMIQIIMINMSNIGDVTALIFIIAIALICCMIKAVIKKYYGC